MFGTIEYRYGHPDHPALDVQLDNGLLELFWFYGLESAEEATAAEVAGA